MELVQWQQRFESWLDEHHASEDSAHDISHFRRVWMTARKIMIHHQADPLVVLTACYFHDIVSLPKNHPERSQSSRLAARKTRDILHRDFPDFPPDRFAAVEHAIEAHSFSAGIAPQSIEAKIVQDADRLEALGAIGLARVFAVSGGLGVALFDAEDPFADARPLDDRAFALDHFQTKLLRLPDTMQTDVGRELAQHNADFLVHFMAKLSAELQGDCIGLDSQIQHRFCRSLPN
ncbi:TPA: phosphohydrolase [Enterobacter kobei]|uniref:phosphohydrolase n=1 Tax=Enterobacter cloacae complex TaxID=354276 RepID=UPI0003BDFF57|nr:MULTISPECIES: phosphohydrolase [Enterobacter cloacae complex]AYL06929.1 phosphohydrolase [Enterobacter kobei]ELE9244178.1 phosphohydrolase [Enterobacter kobei]ESN24976.1 metal dependent phosphohydrolaase [Enterobacter sp. MGH 22]KLR28097.1 hydrolase [Enterobacter kobei]MCE1263291.1 phosphohydrolase [Enterobacter kobei]